MCSLFASCAFVFVLLLRMLTVMYNMNLMFLCWTYSSIVKEVAKKHFWKDLLT